MAWRAFLLTASGWLCRSQRPSSGGQTGGGGGRMQPVGTSQLSSTQPPSTLRTPQVSAGMGQNLWRRSGLGWGVWEAPQQPVTLHRMAARSLHAAGRVLCSSWCSSQPQAAPCPSTTQRLSPAREPGAVVGWDDHGLLRGLNRLPLVQQPADVPQRCDGDRSV